MFIVPRRRRPASGGTRTRSGSRRPVTLPLGRAVLDASLEDRTLLTVLLPGHAETPYVTGLPSAPAGLTLDTATRTFYYADDGNSTGVLRKIAPDRSVSVVTASFSTGGGFYPYVATEIQFFNGSVYTALGNGELRGINATTGAATTLTTLPNFANETGIGVLNGKLYVSPGTGTSGQLWEYDLATSTAVAKVPGLPGSTFGVEADAVSGKVYLATPNSGGGTGAFYGASPGVGGISHVATAPAGLGKFAVDPTGQYLFTRDGGNVWRVKVSDGTAVMFQTDLEPSSTRELVFGPSSSGSGSSLYVANGNGLLEVTGFPAATPGGGPARITGVRYDDLNANGRRDAGEPGRAGLLMYLDANGNGLFDAAETIATTNASGAYEFSVPGPGTYRVGEVGQTGWIQTGPSTGPTRTIRDPQRLFQTRVNPANLATTIVEIDPSTGVPLNGFAAPAAVNGLGPQGLALGPEGLFHIDGFGAGPHVLWRLDPNTGAVISSHAVDSAGAPPIVGAAYLSGKVYLRPVGTNQVLVWDPATATLKAPLAVANNLGDGLTGAADRNALFATFGLGQIVQLDPSTGQVVRTLSPSIGSSFGGLAYVNGQLLVADTNDPGTTFRIDPASSQVLGTFTLPPDQGISTAVGGDGYVPTRAAGQRVFAARVAAGVATIVELDPATGSVVNGFLAPGTVGGAGPQGLALGPNGLYYIDGSGGGPHVLWRLNPETGAVLGSQTVDAAGSPTISGLASLGGRLYLGRPATGQVLVWDPVAGASVTVLNVAGGIAGGLTGAADLGVLFALSPSGQVVEIDPATGSALRGFAPVPGVPLAGLAYADHRLLASTYSDTSTVFRIDPSSGTVLGTFVAGGTGLGVVSGLAGDGLDPVAASPRRLFEVRASGASATIYEISPIDGSLLNRFPAPAPIAFAGPQGLAVGPNSLFYLDGSTSGPHTLWELDPDTGAVLSGHVVDAAAPIGFQGVGYLGGKVYLETSANQIIVWDPVSDTRGATLNVSASIVGGLTGAGDLGALFDSNFSGQIFRIDPSTGAILATLNPGVGGFGGGLAYVGGVLLAAPSADPSTVYRIHPQTGQVLGAFTPAGAGQGMLTGLGGDAAPVSQPAGQRLFQVRAYPASGTSTIQEISLVDGSILRSFAPPVVTAVGAQGLAVGPRSLFYLASSSPGPRVLWQLDRETGAVIDSHAVDAPGDPGIDALAYLDGKVYLLRGGSGQVLVWDPALAQVVATLPVSAPVIGGLTAAADRGLLFATTSTSQIVAIDPLSGQVLRTWSSPTGTPLAGLAYVDGKLLASDVNTPGTIYRIDPASGGVTSTFTSGGAGTVVSLGGEGAAPAAKAAQRLYELRVQPATRVGTIVEIDPATGSTLRLFPAPGGPVAIDGPQGLALGPNSLFYLDGSASGPHTLWQLDLDTGAVVSSHVVDAASPRRIAGLAYLGGKVYLQAYQSNTLLVWDPATASIVAERPLSAPVIGGLTGASDLDALFGSNEAGQIVRIDPLTGVILATLTPAGVGPLNGGLAYVNGVLLAAAWSDPSTVYRINPSTGAVLGAFTPAGGGLGRLSGLAGDGSSPDLIQPVVVEVAAPASRAQRLFEARVDPATLTVRIHEIDPATGAHVRDFPAPGGLVAIDGLQGLAVGPNSLFYLDGSASGPHTLWELDLDTGAVVSSHVVDAASPRLIAGLAYLGGKVYLQAPYSNSLLVWDPATASIVAERPVSVQLIGGLTGASDLGALFGSNAVGWIFRIDPLTGGILATLPPPGVGPLNGGLAYVNGVLLAAAWADPSTVYRINPSTGAVLGAFTPAGGGQGKLSGLGGDAAIAAPSPGQRLFSLRAVGTTATIHELSPLDGSVIRAFPAPAAVTFAGEQGLALGPNGLYFLDGSGAGPHVLWTLDPDTGAVVSSHAVDSPGSPGFDGVAFLGGKLYLQRHATSAIVVWDPVTSSVVATLSVTPSVLGGLTGAADLGVLFATSDGPGPILVLDPLTGAVLRTLPSPAPGTYLLGLAYVNGELLASTATDPGTIHRINPVTGAVVGTFTPGGAGGGAIIKGLAGDGIGFGSGSGSGSGLVFVAPAIGDRQLASPAPPAPSLDPASDTGVSPSDGTTRRDNSVPGRSLTFLVSGVMPGAALSLYADGVLIATATGVFPVTTLVTNGSTPLSDGVHQFTLRQTLPGRRPSTDSSPPRLVTVDTAPPTADIAIVAPDPRYDPVATMSITFNEPIAGLDLADLGLTRDGDPIDLAGASLDSPDGRVWTLGNLSGKTKTPGLYRLRLVAPASGITDLAGNPIELGTVTSFTVLTSHVDLAALTHSPANDGTIRLTYTVTGTVDPFFVTIYRAAGTSYQPGDTLLTVLYLSDPADLTGGAHTKTYALGNAPGKVPLPGFGSVEVDTDYRILAVANAGAPSASTVPFVGVYHGPGGDVLVQGGETADTVNVAAGTIDLTVNGLAYGYTTPDVSRLRIRTHGGNDTFEIGAGIPRRAYVWAGEDDDALTSGATTLIHDGGAGNNSATINGSGAAEDATLHPTSASLVGAGFNVGTTRVSSVVLNLGALSTAYLHDSTGNDTLTASSTTATLSGPGFSQTVNGAAGVYAYASTGVDTATFSGSTGKDTFYTNSVSAYMRVNPGAPGSYQNWAFGFEAVTANAGAGGDVAYIDDPDGNDTVTVTPATLTMTGAGYSVTANAFAQATVFGGAVDAGDTASLTGSTGKDMFVASPNHVQLAGTGFDYTISYYPTVTTDGNGGNDEAILTDAALDGLYTGAGNQGVLTGGSGATAYSRTITNFWLVAIDGRNSANNKKKLTLPLSYTLVELGAWVPV